MNYPGSRRLIKNWIIAIILALTAGILKEGAAQENDKYGNDFFATLDFHKVILNKNQSKPDKYPNTISREQALDDFRYAAYFLKYGYGGYDYYEGKNGFLWDHYFTSVIDSINTKETWKVQDYAELLSNLTKNNIEDGHFHISYGKDKRYQNYSRWNPYRAGEKIDTANCSLDDKGEILKEQDYLSDGKIVKTDMVVLKKKADYITCKKPDGGEERIALTPIQVSTQEKSGLFEEKEIQKDVYYISLSGFNPGHPDEMNAFIDSAKTLSNYPYVVLDLRNNSGGSDPIFFRWLENIEAGYLVYPLMKTVRSLASAILDYNSKFNRLERVKKNTKNKKEINSLKKRVDKLGKTMRTYLEQKDYYSKTFEQPGTSARNIPLGNKTYDGKIFILVNEECYSTCELVTAMAKQFPNIVTVGVNTGGMNSFGDISPVFLPNSRLGYYLPFKAFYLGENGNMAEGRGVMPTVWSEGNILKEILSFIENSKHDSGRKKVQEFRS